MSIFRRELRPVWMLSLGACAWGVSFPLAKAAMLQQQAAVPEAGSLYHTSVLLFIRFLLSALALLAIFPKQIAATTRDEWKQGLLLALFGGTGMLLQGDGLNYTAASTSAFLTQLGGLFVPIFLVVRDRRLPEPRTMFACALMVVGTAVLVGVDWSGLRLGRGEWETILCAMLFAGEIIALESTAFPGNRAANTAFVLLLGKSVISLGPVLIASQPAAGFEIFLAPRLVPVMVLLTFACTLFPFYVMVRWQPFVSPTHAGIIYCGEPIGASVSSLQFPALLSAWLGVQYGNETFTPALIWGGALILSANLLMLFRTKSAVPHGSH